jgi:hypothetical protein
MMIVALVLFVAVILACLVAPSGAPAKKHAPAAKQPALQMGEVVA